MDDCIPFTLIDLTDKSSSVKGPKAVSRANNDGLKTRKID